MTITRRIIAVAAGTFAGLFGIAVATAYVYAMLSSAPSLGNIAKLAGASYQLTQDAAPTWWEKFAQGSSQFLANVELSGGDGILMVAPLDRQQLQNRFAAMDYVLPEANTADPKLHEVPRLYLRSLPYDLAERESSQERKRDFVSVMLPLVLAGNEKILADRSRIEKFALQIQTGGNLYAVNKAWLIQLAAHYGIAAFDPNTGDWRELLRRVDAVPPSLAIAQAALESGWGTSRFATQGNAVFGQFSWKPGSGLIPAARSQDSYHEIRRFSQLSESVSAYMHNLNSHNYYGKFRSRRADAREAGEPASGLELVKYLDRYSEEGDKYINEVRGIIETNLLQEMDAARLRPANSAWLSSS